MYYWIGNIKDEYLVSKPWIWSYILTIVLAVVILQLIWDKIVNIIRNNTVHITTKHSFLNHLRGWQVESLHKYNQQVDLAEKKKKKKHQEYRGDNK